MVRTYALLLTLLFATSLTSGCGPELASDNNNTSANDNTSNGADNSNGISTGDGTGQSDSDAGGDEATDDTIDGNTGDDDSTPPADASDDTSNDPGDDRGDDSGDHDTSDDGTGDDDSIDPPTNPVESFTVTANTEGPGSVALNPPGGVYEAGTQVTITATGDPTYSFVGFSGDQTGTENPAVVAVNSDLNLTAKFSSSMFITGAPVGGIPIVYGIVQEYDPFTGAELGYVAGLLLDEIDIFALPQPFFLPSGNLIMIGKNNIIEHDATTGEFLGELVPVLELASVIGSTSTGNIVVSNGLTKDIDLYDGDTGESLGVLIDAAEAGLDASASFATASNGDLLVLNAFGQSLENLTSEVLRFDSQTGELLGKIVDLASLQAGLAIDLETTTNDEMFVRFIPTQADQNSQILMFSQSSGASLGSISVPEGVAPFSMAVGPNQLLYVLGTSVSESVTRLYQFDIASGALVDTLLEWPTTTGVLSITFK